MSNIGLFFELGLGGRGRLLYLGSSMLDNRVGQVLVVSLPEDKERRSHIQKHFAETGIRDYSYVDGIPFNSEAVKQFYLSGRVKEFPNCFRCNKPACECVNNILIPQQVANWLAFKKTWVKAAIYHGLTLVCEDDVLFYPGAMNRFSKALDQIDIHTDSPLLVRLAHSGLTDNVDLNEIDEINILDTVVMSNVAFIMNAPMARLLLANFHLIETTSDIFIHDWCAKFEGVNAYTVEPLLATDLSFNKNFARFVSRIHPKGMNEEDEKRKKTHIKRVSSPKEYQQTLQCWLDN